jgi:hypothetical protein
VTEIELTLFEKRGGILTKKISIDASGKVHNDSSECRMMLGTARRVTIDGVAGLDALFGRMQKNQAIGLGVLRSDLASTVNVVTAKKFRDIKDPPAATITRANKYFTYQPRRPALLLFDVDLKDATDAVRQRVAAHGDDHWAMLCDAFPGLAGAAHLTRASTSAGLSRSDTKEKFPSSGGSHNYVPIADGADAERALYAAHDHAVIAGYGWVAISVAGRFLRRSIVDRLVAQPGRLVFEAAPDILPPLEQDPVARRPIAVAGATVDALGAWPPLSVGQRAQVDKTWAEMERAREPERQRVRAAYVEDRAPDLARKRGISLDAAKRVIERRCDATLLPDDEVDLDDEGVVKVGAILDDPAAYDGEHLSDPLEGPDYGRGKAYVHVGVDGEPWIYSFAHGGINYSLRYDAAAVRARLAAAQDADLVDRLIKLLLWAEVTEVEEDAIVDEVAHRAHAKFRSIKAMIKAARQERRKRRAEAARERDRAKRTDPRPQVPRPAGDAPLIPTMQAVNDVVTLAPLRERLFRNLDDVVARKRRLVVPNTHAFTGDDATNEDAPEQWVIAPLDEFELTEALERNIDYVHPETGRSVTPPARVVRAYRKRGDGVLPTIAAVAISPVILADGGVLAHEDDVDVARGIAFAIPREVMDAVPRREECTPDAVRDAMEFLCDEWMRDVSTNFAGKCVIVANGLTLIERSLLPERPAFWYSAGRRGAGKTTTIKMLVAAVTGILPAASPWSTDEEERKKAIFGYFLAATAYILWDNIKRNSKINCPHVERACTTQWLSDRKLGVSEVVVTSAGAVHMFTGNNVAPRGDLASRSLLVTFEVDRSDPENRNFRHSDVIAWTLDNRLRLLRAMYTILLGNPTLDLPRDAPMQTRFKMWWRLVGSAVENAAAAVGETVTFKDLFLQREEEDATDDVDLGDVLEVLHSRWPREAEFIAQQVADLVNAADLQSRTMNETDEQFEARLVGPRLVRDFFFGNLRRDGWVRERVSARTVTRALGAHVDNMVRHGDDKEMVLRVVDRGRGHSRAFKVVVRDAAARPAKGGNGAAPPDGDRPVNEGARPTQDGR